MNKDILQLRRYNASRQEIMTCNLYVNGHISVSVFIPSFFSLLLFAKQTINCMPMCSNAHSIPILDSIFRNGNEIPRRLRLPVMLQINRRHSFQLRELAMERFTVCLDSFFCTYTRKRTHITHTTAIYHSSEKNYEFTVVPLSVTFI